MVQSEKIRTDFVKRLKKALAQAGIVEWGAGARLAEITKMTAKAASKWLNGEAMPGRKNMLAIAEALCVRVEWLEYGNGSMKVGEDDAYKSRAGKPKNAVAEDRSSYPLTSASPDYLRLHRIAADLSEEQLKLLCGIADVIRKDRK